MKRGNIMKSIKKLLVFGLALATVVTSTLVVPAKGDAKAKVKLSKTNLNLYVGATHKLKVKGTKKKVKWSTANKKIATVKKGTVKAVAPGATKITAKVGKKKYTCKVRVNQILAVVTPAPSPAVPTSRPIADPQQQIIANNALAANVAARVDKLTSGEILYTIVNNNTQEVPTITLSVMLCDTAGTPVDTDTVTIENLLPGETTYGLYTYGSKCSLIDAAKSTVSVTVTQGSSYKKYVTSYVNVTGAKNVDNKVVMTYVNNTAQSVYVRGFVFYKDASGAVLAVDDIIENLAPGATEFDTLSRPSYRYDMIDHEAYDDIEYASVDWIYRAYYY